MSVSGIFDMRAIHHSEAKLIPCYIYSGNFMLMCKRNGGVQAKRVRGKGPRGLAYTVRGARKYISLGKVHCFSVDNGEWKKNQWIQIRVLIEVKLYMKTSLALSRIEF